MAERYVIALDQGTTSSRAVLIDRTGAMVDCVQRTFEQIYPQPGWVEHNPHEILLSQLGALTELVNRHGLSRENVAAIGIDDHRVGPRHRRAYRKRHRVAVPPNGPDGRRALRLRGRQTHGPAEDRAPA